MNGIHPLVICGGNGTRLWPMSRRQSPKQFQRIGGPDSPTFFQSAVKRHSGPGFEQPYIISSVKHRATIAAQLGEMEFDAKVILEPMARNTGPAVLASAFALAETDPDSLILVVPADHIIEGDINTSILAMADAAREGRIITFGIVPRFPETGFGYITDGGEVPAHAGLHSVDGFVEKPPLGRARELVDSGRAYWASGISLFSARTIIEEYARFDPESAEVVRRAYLAAREDEDGTVLAGEHFGEAEALPTEQVVFEKTDRIALAPLHVDWNDVGSWSAMYGIQAPDPQGNVLQGDVIAVDTERSLVRSTTRLVTVVGLQDVIVIETPDALLVTKVGHCQNVKKVAEHLKAANRVEAEQHRRLEYSWGHTEALVDRDATRMSMMTIRPGAEARLEAEAGREIIVTRGTVHLSAGGRGVELTAGQRARLDATLTARMANRSPEAAEVVMIDMPSEIVAIAPGPEKALPAPDIPKANYA